MTSVVSKADYDQRHAGWEMNYFTHQLLQKINKPAGSYSFIIVKAAAACLLLLLASTFILQERNFYQNRIGSPGQAATGRPGIVRLHKGNQEENPLSIHGCFCPSGYAACKPRSVKKLLTAYVRENCGYNTKDIKALKKMLIQAGLIN